MNLECSWDNVNLPQNDEENNLDKDVTGEENEVKTYRVKDYIPKRSAAKFLKIPYIVGVAIIFILIIIIIILASIQNKSVVWSCPNTTVTQEVILNVPENIILLDQNRFWIYDPRKASLTLLLEVKNPAQSFVVDATRTLFWIDANSSNIMTLHQHGNKTQKNMNSIFDEARAKPHSMALDPINNNLYILSESIQGLIVMNLDTKYYALLLMNLIEPRYVAVDAEKGFVFIGSTKWIKKAGMDGNNLTKILDDKIISAITLDREAERIYYINNQETVETCLYSGLFQQQLLTDSVPILDITILDGFLFWLRRSGEFHNTTLWSCKTKNELMAQSCDDHTMMYNDAGYATSLQVTGRARDNPKPQNSTNRQKCEHVSLGQVACVCNMGSQLIFNKKCEPVNRFVLYTMNSVTRSRTLDMTQKIVSEPFWPTPYRVKSLTFKGEIDFDYDFENDDFYFSDDKQILKIKLRGKSPQQETLLTINNRFVIEDLAYDWLTGNMYFSKRSELSTADHSLVVFNVKKGGSFQKTLKYFTYDSNFGLQASAYGLAVYPSRGLLFFTAGEDGKRYIYQTKMNGTVISKITNIRYIHEYRLIAVDYDKDRLYWISSESTVTHANFDGTDRKDVGASYFHKAKTISISGQWMYISDVDSVSRVNKEDASDYTRISPLNYPGFHYKVSGARIIDQALVVGNPCRENNGGCEQLCFYGKNATCGCADGFSLTSHTCV